MKTKREYATADEVAAMLGVSSVTVRTLARNGQLPAYRIGKLWRFDPAEIRAYMSNQRKGASA